jgi:predicted patatin/cPLA2 family phospholipase
MKTSIILEGGGMRCVYTAGIIDALIENNIEFDSCYAVSAGAYNGVNLLTHQKGRAFEACTKYIFDWHYFSMRNKLLTGDMFSEDFVYHTIPDKLIPVDYEAFKKSKTSYYSVVINVRTGKAEYLPVKDLKRDMDKIRASGSLPFVSKMVTIDNEKYLDGGIADSIPVKRALSDGCDRAVVVLTQHKGFVKEQTSTLKEAKVLYRRYPKFVEAMATRHERYNETLRFIEEGEKKGNILAIYPKGPVAVSRIDKDMTKIEKLYKDGYDDGRGNAEKIRNFIKG